ncbi:hypothetical protein ACIQUB_07110 [Rhizobium sp. NPDC090275]|uniref:hypothetical protein n=1 Tax=Rhizobium sp. NPDC090275 TaxID=3364498 RepID=UPI00383B705B
MTRAQFVFRIWIAIAKGWNMKAAEALPFARQAYRDYIANIGVPFGHPSYSWDVSAANVVAEEYALRFGEAA